MICRLCDRLSHTEDEHHIVPREYDGHDLPVIMICPTCHATLHRCINNPLMKDEFIASIPRKNKQLVIASIKILEDLKAIGKKGTKVHVTAYIDRTLHERIKLASVTYNTSMKDLIESVLLKAFGG